MISILIPCYNYPSYDLVSILYKQCVDSKISFEILVSEDGGQEYLDENEQINHIENCKYLVNKTNLGRSGNINRLLRFSKYDLKLILDCDVWPKSSNFLNHYINYSNQFSSFVSFGGIIYNNKQNQTNNLRYNYGINREAISVEKRRKAPVKSLLTSNLLLKNCNQQFDERISTYGYEDLVFAHRILEKKIEILHIDNPVYHTNIEGNEEYLNKTQKALQTLISIEKKKVLNTGFTRISKIYHIFAKLRLRGLLKLAYSLLHKVSYKALLKKGKPLWLFDIYKLIFFSKHY